MNKEEFRKVAAETVSKVIGMMKEKGMPAEVELSETLTMTIFSIELANALFDSDDSTIEIMR